MKKSDIRNGRYIIVDVGAGCKALYQDWLERYSGLILHVIEPHPVLAQSFRTFRDAFPPQIRERLYVHEFACVAPPDDVDNVDFHLSNDRSSSSTLPFNDAGVRKWRYPIGRRYLKTESIIQVRCQTLTRFLADAGVLKVDFLNIEVQGNAMAVLDGMSMRDWERVRDVNIKVHTTDFDMYQAQTKNYDVMDQCRRHYLRLQGRSTRSRRQEDVLSFRNELLEMKKCRFTSFAKQALCGHV